MSNILDMPGVHPELREYLALQEKALNGDIVMVLDPETTGTSATSSAFTRTVVVSIETAAGELHEWVNSAFTTSVAIASDTAGTGAATIASTTLTFVDGRASIIVSATGAWAAEDTNTLTASAVVLGGISVTGGTSVDTIIA